jgi:2-C-methyl-D-erythritol 4-phosphate cytidylyltransferase
VKATAIVVAAGKGRRFKSKKKPFVKLGRKPLLAYALTLFERSPVVGDIVLVVDKTLLKKAKALVKKFRFNKVRRIVSGGNTRSASVKNGLRCVNGPSSVVLIHDGVRPFVTSALIKKLVNTAKRFGAAISAVPVKPTIKVSKDGSFVSYTPQRRNLWEAQTPQAFRRSIIERAYRRIGALPRRILRHGAFRGAGFTDDSVLAELGGTRVKIVKGDYRNIKITTVEDLKMAEALLK